MACSVEQTDLLWEYMMAHKDLARGRLRSMEARMESRLLWNQLTNQLNACGGGVKTVAQWQKVWRDKKYGTKKAVAAQKRSASATGGGPSECPPLSHWEERIVAIMGEGFGEPQTTASVNAFRGSDFDDEIESYAASNQNPERAEPEPGPSTASSSLGLFSVRSETRRSKPILPERADVSAQSAVSEHVSERAVSGEPSSNNYTASRPRRRRRQSILHRSISVSRLESKLLELEKQKIAIKRQILDTELQKVTELSGIRLALNELISLMRDRR